MYSEQKIEKMGCSLSKADGLWKATLQGLERNPGDLNRMPVSATIEAEASTVGEAVNTLYETWELMLSEGWKVRES